MTHFNIRAAWSYNIQMKNIKILKDNFCFIVENARNITKLERNLLLKYNGKLRETQLLFIASVLFLERETTAAVPYIPGMASMYSSDWLLGRENRFYSIGDILWVPVYFYKSFVCVVVVVVICWWWCCCCCCGQLLMVLWWWTVGAFIALSHHLCQEMLV